MTEKEYIKRIGKRIEEKREAINMSREEFSKKAKLTRMHLYRIEIGANAASITTLRRIAKELGVNVSELINVE